MAKWQWGEYVNRVGLRMGQSTSGEIESLQAEMDSSIVFGTLENGGDETMRLVRVVSGCQVWIELFEGGMLGRVSATILPLWVRTAGTVISSTLENWGE